MKQTFRQSMAWLHTWTGLLLGWLMFAIFVTGTAAVFQDEITRWMQPEIAAPVEPATAAAGAVRYLQKAAPGSASWYITLPTERRAAAQLYWSPPPGAPADAPTSALIDPGPQAAPVRETRGGDFLYRFHYDLHYMPWYVARYIVGVAAMSMLIALLSGVVTHKKIIAEFFLLRLRKGQRSWLDAHNMSSVFALPFFLMMTYTGLVTLGTMYMPWGVAANYSDESGYLAERFPGASADERSGVAAPLAPFGPMFAAARERWGGAGVGFVQVLNPGDANAKVVLTRSQSDAVGARGPTVTFEGATGALVGAGPRDGPATAAESVMIGLHSGRFAGPGLRWLYFLSGALGAVMVGTGLVLWTVKRRARLRTDERPSLGLALVQRLNLATLVGLNTGLAVYFLANRLLPVGLSDRPAAEIDSFFVAWGAVLVWSVCRPLHRAWAETLAATAALFLAVPAVSALTTSRHLFASLAAGDAVFAGFDLVMLAMALGFGLAARRAGRERPRLPAPGPATEAASA